MILAGVPVVLVLAGTALAALFTIGLVFSRLYRRASKETSFVRTGFGGQRVIMNGGALVLPVLHELIHVNMNTLRLEVRRANDQALITRDRMRVDVQAEFYVRVKPTIESIADAAQTLGRKTMNPNELKTLVEGKFVDALRSVAASLTMEELHEKRADFVQKVQQAVTEDLLKNGLELETVSLTGLDQTSREFFNPDNAFDAQGLTTLTEQIETRRKQRNDIEQDTQVAIQQKNLEAERQRLELSKQEEYAKLEQEREIAIRRAAQSAEVVSEQASKTRSAREAEIGAQQQVDMAQLVAKRAIEEARIEMERQIREREIVKGRAVEMAEVEKQKTLELARQDQAIAIAEKSRAQSEAQAQADAARAEAVRAEERVSTVRDSERAERQKTIELIEAAKEAERSAISIRVAAETEKQASEDRAVAVKTLAEAEAERVRIAALGEAEAEKTRADAAERRYAVDAQGRRLLNDADNMLSAEQIAMQVKLAIIKHLPDIIRESVKPLEQIDAIRIVKVDGLGQQGNSGRGDGVSAAAGSASLSDQVVDSALRFRAHAPLVDSLMKELGMSGADLSGLTSCISNGTPGGGAEHLVVPGLMNGNGASK